MTTPSTTAVVEVDWEKEDRTARNASEQIDFELVAQEDSMMKPDYGIYPNPDEYYESQYEIPDHEYNY